MNAYSLVKILKISPSTVEKDGHIYDNDLLVKASTGEEFWIFDLDRKARKEMEGQIKKILISTTNDWGNYEIEKTNENIGIKKIDGKKHGNAYPTLILVGEVENIEEKTENEIYPYTITLNARFGRLLVGIGKEASDFLIRIKVGDIIKVKTGRLDLKGVIEN